VPPAHKYDHACAARRGLPRVLSALPRIVHSSMVSSIPFAQLAYTLGFVAVIYNFEQYLFLLVVWRKLFGLRCSVYTFHLLSPY
jgi:hypothetical protein